MDAASSSGSVPSPRKNGSKQNAVKSNSLQYRSNYKVIWIDSKRFVYRCDGICKENPSLNVVTVSDPRSSLLQFRKKTDLDLLIPSFILDNNSLGRPLKREVSIVGLNDNIDEDFLKNICRKFGELTEVIIFHHPVTQKHLGLAYVVFCETGHAKSFRLKYDGMTLMGSALMCFEDPYASEISRRFEKITGVIPRVPKYLENISFDKLKRLREEFCLKSESPLEDLRSESVDVENIWEYEPSTSRQHNDTDEETKSQRSVINSNNQSDGRSSPFIAAPLSVENSDEMPYCPPPPPIPPPPPCPPPLPSQFFPQPLRPPLCLRPPVPAIIPPVIRPLPFDPPPPPNHFSLPRNQGFVGNPPNWPGFLLPPPQPALGHSNQSRIFLNRCSTNSSENVQDGPHFSKNILAPTDGTLRASIKKLSDDSKTKPNDRTLSVCELNRQSPRSSSSEFVSKSSVVDCSLQELSSKRLQRSQENGSPNDAILTGENRKNLPSISNKPVLQEVVKETGHVHSSPNRLTKELWKSEMRIKDPAMVKIDPASCKSASPDEKESCSNDHVLRDHESKKRKVYTTKKIPIRSVKRPKLSEDMSGHRWSSTSSSDDCSGCESSSSSLKRNPKILRKRESIATASSRKGENHWFTYELLEDVSESGVSSSSEKSPSVISFNTGVKLRDSKRCEKLPRRLQETSSDSSARFSLERRLKTMFSKSPRSGIETSPHAVSVFSDDVKDASQSENKEFDVKHETLTESSDHFHEQSSSSFDPSFSSKHAMSAMYGVKKIDKGLPAVSLSKTCNAGEEINEYSHCRTISERISDISKPNTSPFSCEETSRENLHRPYRSVNKFAKYNSYLKAVFADMMFELKALLINDLKKKIEISVYESVEDCWNSRFKSIEQNENHNALPSVSIATSQSDYTEAELVSSSRPTFLHSSKNSLQEMILRITAESKAEIGSVIEPNTASLLGTGFFYQGFSKNMPSFKRKLTRKTSEDREIERKSKSRSSSLDTSRKRSLSPYFSPFSSASSRSSLASSRSSLTSSRSSLASSFSCASPSPTATVAESCDHSKEINSSLTESSRTCDVINGEKKTQSSAQLSSQEEDGNSETTVDNDDVVSNKSPDTNKMSNMDVTNENLCTSANSEVEHHEKSNGKMVTQNSSSECPRKKQDTNVASRSVFGEIDMSSDLYKKIVYDSFYNDHCYFSSDLLNRHLASEVSKASIKKSDNCAPEDLISPVVFRQKNVVSPVAFRRKDVSPILRSQKSSSKSIKGRRRIRNELASLLPPPVDRHAFLRERELEEKKDWKERKEDAKKQIIAQFLDTGLDKEDLKYLEQGFHEMQNDGSAEWNRQLYWVPNQETPSVDTSSSMSRHQSGCVRAEGYYKVSQKQKIKGMRRAEAGTNFSERDETAVRHLAQATREARSMNRRLLTSIGETSDIFKVNQLKYRKKMIKFSPSRIHGWGLFALEDVCPDEMIVEYVGQKIRPTVADEREKHYERLGMGSSYLFRIDSDNVIDATRMGNFARFINHSCLPNCYAKVVAVDGDKRIVIYSKTQINKGDEITYDYKFPIEDDKIVCLCGSLCCRGFLN